jgi:hypothetical protein
MYSPQPLSALQRGAKSLLTPFFCLQEKGAGGMSTCKVEKYSQLLLFIPDSQFKLKSKAGTKIQIVIPNFKRRSVIN